TISVVGFMMFSCCFGGIVLFPVSTAPNQLRLESFLAQELDAVSRCDLAEAAAQPEPDQRQAGLARHARDLQLLAELQSHRDHEQALLEDRMKWINPWMRAGFRQQIEMSDDFYRKIYGSVDVRWHARQTIDMRQAQLESLPWWFAIIALLVLALLWFLWS